MKHMSSQYHIPMIIQGVYSCFEQQERKDFGGGGGGNGGCSCEGVWSQGKTCGRMEDFSSKCVRERGAGGSCLSSRERWRRS